MANTVALTAVIKAKDEASKVFSNVGKSTDTLGGQFKALGKLAAGAGIAAAGAAIAVGVSSVKMAGEFQKSMANVSTLVDTTTESMENMSNEVLDIAKRVPVEVADLSAALYDVRSAGISASDAMMVLEKSAKLGVSGLGTTSEAVNLATSAINSFGFEGEEAAKVFDTIQLTVKSGKTTIPELSQAFGMVAGTAATAGVSFNELMAATAALTTTGLKSSVAQTQLRSAILAIQAPTGDMSDLINNLGYESGEAMLKELGLVGSMEAIDGAAKGNIEILKPAYGSVEALGSAISLTGEQGEAFIETSKQMADATGVADEAFQKEMETFDSSFQLLQNNIEVAKIEIGNKFLPMLKDRMPQIIEIVNSLADGLINVLDVAIKVAEGIGKVIEFKDKLIGGASDFLDNTSEEFSQSGWNIMPTHSEGGMIRGMTAPKIEEDELDNPNLDMYKKNSTIINLDLRGSTVTDEEITNKLSDLILKKVDYAQ